MTTVKETPINLAERVEVKATAKCGDYFKVGGTYFVQKELAECLAKEGKIEVVSVKK